MDITRMGGLALGALAKMGGLPFVSELSMLVEEMAKSTQELVSGLKRVEAVVTGQVLGKASSAKQSLKNSTNSDFSEAEKQMEVIRAWHLFEECYWELEAIPHLAKYRGEVAFYVAMSHALLGRKAMTKEWLKVSEEDFNAFAAIKPETISDVENAVELAASTSGVVVASLGVAFLFVSGIGFVGFLACGAATAGGVGTYSKMQGRSDNRQKAIEQFRQEQRLALIDAKEVAVLIQQLDDAIIDLT